MILAKKYTHFEVSDLNLGISFQFEGIEVLLSISLRNVDVLLANEVNQKEKDKESAEKMCHKLYFIRPFSGI